MTNTFIFYVYREGVTDAEEYAVYKDRFGYKESFRKYLNQKKEEGKELSDTDKIMTDVLFYGIKVTRGGFTKLMQTLRRYDEIGLSNDIYDTLDEIKVDPSIVAVSLGVPSRKESDLKEYNV